MPSTPVLDGFDRADEGPPPSSSWTTPVGMAGCVVKNSQLAPDPNEGGNGRCVWNTQHGPDCEAYVTISVRPNANTNNTIKLYIRAADQSGYASGYSVHAYRNPQTGDSYIYLYEGAGWKGGYQVNWGNGDSIGVRAIGTSIEALYRPAGGSWSTVIQVEAYNYSDEGYLFIYIDTADTGTRLDDFGGGNVAGIVAPTNLQAHTVDETIVLTWVNQPPEYTYLTVERAEEREGPWDDLGLELEPDADTATDEDPDEGAYWYRVYVENDHGDATTPPVQSEELVRQTWETVAHAMGIPDLAEPIAPFTYGEAGEQLFLVCCLLWRMGVAPGLPDPVYSKPADWREFIETGTYPT